MLSLNLNTPVHCCQLFPEEIWEIILENVEDSKSLVSLFYTCTTLRHLLARKEPQIFFSLAIPHISKYLKSRDMKRCRLVCKRWSKSADDFRQHEATLVPWKPSFKQRQYRLRVDLPQVYPGLKLFSNYRISSFLEAMEDHPGNPFPTRCVQLEKIFSSRRRNGEEGFEENKVFDLLNKFGSHIWTLHYTAAVYDEIFEVLRLAPNLIHLVLVDTNCNFITARNTAPLFNSVPEMPKLKSLCIQTAELWTFVSIYGGQLEYLECSADLLIHADSLTKLENRLTFKQLTSLKIWQGERNNWYTDLLNFLSDSSRFPKLERVALPQAKATGSGEQLIPPNIFLSAISQLAAIVQELHIPVESNALAEMKEDNIQHSVGEACIGRLRILGVSASMEGTPVLDKILEINSARSLRILQLKFYYDFNKLYYTTWNHCRRDLNVESDSYASSMQRIREKCIPKMVHAWPKLEQIQVLQVYQDWYPLKTAIYPDGDVV